MGKRSTNTTKGGKFMNPTDQARKEARKKELKKNKKQRQIVRTAVLKGKNPREIIEELEKIDDMEYNPITPCPLNQKVMYEKRRKLAETWDRVIKLYEKDAPEQWADLKKLWTNYQGRKIEVVKYYESVISAQDVEVDSIPLPNTSSAGFEGGWDEDGMGIPLPPPSLYIPPGPPRSVLKKPPSVLDVVKPLLCPGVPAGPPPSLEDYDVVEVEGGRKRTVRFGDEREDQVDDKVGEDQDSGSSAPGHPNSLQKKMLAMAGQDLDQFMREMEEVHRTREAEKAADLQARLARLEDPLESTQPTPPGMELPGELDSSSYLLAGPPGAAPPGPPPEAPPMLYRPASHMGAPPLRPGVPPPGVRPPPGPPPGRPPVRQAAPLRQGQAPPGVRLPPGPPPGVPPRGARPNMPRPLGVVSAKPQLNKMEIKTGKVIEGAPVMRNLRSDVTRFVPTNLRVKREEKKEPIKRKTESYRPYSSVGGHSFAPPQAKNMRITRPTQPLLPSHPPLKTKDDAYADFMKEMQDLL